MWLRAQSDANERKLKLQHMCIYICTEERERERERETHTQTKKHFKQYYKTKQSDAKASDAAPAKEAKQAVLETASYYYD